MSEEIKLSDKLTMKKKNIFDSADAEKKAKIFEFAEGYKSFLDMAKTEREASVAAIEAAKRYGFTEYRLGEPLKAGDKKYYNNRGKSVSNRYRFTRIAEWRSLRLIITAVSESISGWQCRFRSTELS